MSENYGDSQLAKRFGVTRYPAIFVGDVLAATPNDFGFYGNTGTQEGGRYAPLKSAAAHDRFRADLTRMIGLQLAGRAELARAEAAPAAPSGIRAWPDIELRDLEGRSVTRASLAGKPVLLEIWATWCPPCRGTLSWLGELEKRHAGKVAVVALAVESPEPAVRKLAAQLELPLTWALGTPEIARAFGDVSAVPTLLLFDAKGQTAGVFYGAPPTLHAEVEKTLEPLVR